MKSEQEIEEEQTKDSFMRRNITEALKGMLKKKQEAEE